MEGASGDEGIDSEHDGHRLLWTAGEPCTTKLKSARDLLQTGVVVVLTSNSHFLSKRCAPKGSLLVHDAPGGVVL